MLLKSPLRQKKCTVILLAWFLILSVASCGGRKREPYVDGFDNINTSDITHYQSIRQKVLYEPVRSFFPEQIPMDPEKVKFSAFECHCQDFFGRVQLRVKHTPEEIDRLYADYDRRKIDKAENSDGLRRWSRNEPSFNTQDDPHELFWPEDFSFLILGDETDSTTTQAGRHYLAGVAISKKRNEIVYWVNY